MQTLIAICSTILILVGLYGMNSRVAEISHAVNINEQWVQQLLHRVDITEVEVRALKEQVAPIVEKAVEVEKLKVTEEFKKLCRQVSRELHNGKFELGEHTDSYLKQQPACLITKRGQVIELWEAELKRIKQLLD